MSYANRSAQRLASSHTPMAANVNAFVNLNEYIHRLLYNASHTYKKMLVVRKRRQPKRSEEQYDRLSAPEINMESDAEYHLQYRLIYSVKVCFIDIFVISNLSYQDYA